MIVLIQTPVRLLGEGLADCLNRRGDIRVLDVVFDLEAVQVSLRLTPVDIVLVDCTQSVDLEEIRTVAERWPQVALVALGLREQQEEVIRCGQAGFLGYITRDVSIEHLCSTLGDVLAGRQACPAEITGGLLRALFCSREAPVEMAAADCLTRRESDVLRLIAQGCTNKEIARELRISIATVKHHVHHVLEKLQVPRRAQAIRRVRGLLWERDAKAMPTRRRDTA